MKKIIFIALMGTFIYACSSNADRKAPVENATVVPDNANEEAESKAHDAKGIGKFKDVQLPSSLDAKMAEAGVKVYDLKCASCHKLTDEKLVGPGWKGVTERRKPEWILNFSTNTDEMIDKDPHAMAMLAECLVRMPNQNLSDDDARHILEFMRKNDGLR